MTRIALLYREKRVEVPKPVGLWGAYVMGLAFAFGWTPCIGPILAAILAVAASEATVAKGAGLLAVYSLGLGIPFLAAAFAVEPFAAFLARFRGYLPGVEKTMGALLVLTGIAFLTGLVSRRATGCSKRFRCLGDRLVRRLRPVRDRAARGFPGLRQLSTPWSSKRRPTICRPIGRPVFVKPQLIDTAGCSVKCSTAP